MAFNILQLLDYRRIWLRLPIAPSRKESIRQFLFTRTPFLFRWSAAYKEWEAVNTPLGILARAMHPDHRATGGRDSCSATNLDGAEPPRTLPVRTIAFYLPQFHAIPENDLWWGKGFTEWTNVKPARPQFEGHYQPRVPADLGYYDLLDSSVIRRQVELARLYGVSAFCFYFYWFGGRRLLEKPLDAYLKDPSLDLPFCICWANEPWSRRWDGLNQEVLIAQQHSAEDDLAFIEAVAPFLKDQRYLRINGRPLLVVYRPDLFPDAEATATRWRRWCQDNGIGDIYLALTQSFDAENPVRYGFDAAIEFPPNNSNPANITDQAGKLNASFAGTIYDMESLVARSFQYQQPPYPLFRGVCPSWDNTARRKNKGTIFANCSPRSFQQWLSNAIADTKTRFPNPDERLIFINAWNEWAEGAYLEPDQRHGYAYLQATRRALAGKIGKQVVLVSHDAHPQGAQILSVNLARMLARDLKLSVAVVLLGKGPLLYDLQEYATVFDLSQASDRRSAMTGVATMLAQRGHSHAIVNTTASGDIVNPFRDAGIQCLCLIHELPNLIRSNGLVDRAGEIAKAAETIVFPATIVAEGFAELTGPSSARKCIRHQGLYKTNPWRWRRANARTELGKRLGLAADTKVVLSAGYGDHRKGIDLFVDCAITILRRRPNTAFVWLGNIAPESREAIAEKLHAGKSKDGLHFLAFDPDTSIYFAGADVYALTSREDPFPSVALEAMDVGLPVVAFSGTGGAAELLGTVGGITAPPFDVNAMSNALYGLLNDPEQAEELGRNAQRYADDHFSFRAYAFDLCAMVGITWPRISVVVPNFNYAVYIGERLATIVNQTMPIYELIILDDASADDSVDRIQAWLSANGTEAKLVVNPSNSGNVFAQWQQGISLATGEYIWVAEADDSSAPDFLESVLPALEEDRVVLSYCESKQIDAAGRILANDYGEYYRPVAEDRWSHSYVAEGTEEIQSALAVLNSIPNASAVVFRADAIRAVFRNHGNQIIGFPGAGDWLIYFRLLQSGRLAFTPRQANYHRRHDLSVIASSCGRDLLHQIQTMQDLIASECTIPAVTRAKALSYRSALESNLQM